MKIIFQRFRDYQLYVNLKKCEFFIIEIEFLNFIVFVEKFNINRKKNTNEKKKFKSQTFREFQMFLNSLILIFSMKTMKFKNSI